MSIFDWIQNEYLEALHSSKPEGHPDVRTHEDVQEVKS